MTHSTDLAALAARGPVDRSDSGPSAELDLATVKALTEFTTAVERAIRAGRTPVVVHQAAPAVRTAPGPDPIDVRIPLAPSGPAVEPEPENLPRLFTRAEVSYAMAATTIATGALAFALDHVSLDVPGFLPIIGCFWLLFSAAAINRWAARHGGIEVVHGRTKVRGHKS
jgi:hypothetical protein